MAFIPPETIEKARQVDLLTYLQTCEPNELVHLSGNHYCTREHDSLKISNGKWYWFSRGFGGYNALDYLIKVKEIPFMEAVERITGQVAYQPRQSQPKPRCCCCPRPVPVPVVSMPIFAAVALILTLLIYASRRDGCTKARPTTMRYLSGWTSTTSPGTPISEEWVLISLAMQMGATSGSLSAFRHRAAIPFTFLKAPSIFCPTQLL